MKTRRYTESQVLHGLFIAWEHITGVDDPFDADTRIDSYLKAAGCWEEMDLADVFRGMEKFFGFTCDDKEWTDFFGVAIAHRSTREWESSVAPKLTFGSLAHFVAERATPQATFDTISILGRNCAPAGVFLGIRQLVSQVAGARVEVFPGARIIDVIRGRTLDEVWSRLHWMTEHSIPRLPRFWREVTGATGCLGCLAVVAAIIATCATAEWAWIATLVLGALILHIAACGYKWLANPIPSQIVTFRDLSMMIAEKRTQRITDE
ncbi:MAG: hypothetical protein ACYC0X_00040 [Pirellulaceae bacterium]